MKKLLVLLALVIAMLVLSAQPVMASVLTDNVVNPDPGVVLLCAVFGAVAAAFGAWASNPLPTPLTAQKIAAMVIGSIIGGAGAFLAVDYSGATSTIMAYIIAFVAGAGISSGAQMIGIKHYAMIAKLKELSKKPQ